MSFQAVAYPLRLVEMAARVESHIASLLASGVVEALDYACLNDFCLLDRVVNVINHDDKEKGTKN